jgi:hypothetical protein
MNNNNNLELPLALANSPLKRLTLKPVDIKDWYSSQTRDREKGHD